MSKNRQEIKNQVEEFFKDHKDKTSEQIKKIKTKAMSINLKLGEKRKLFCKKCQNPYNSKDSIKITKTQKRIKCSKCGRINVWKIENHA